MFFLQRDTGWLLLVLILFFNTSFGANLQSSPQGMLYQGSLIDPLCLYNENQAMGTVDLKTCGLRAKPRYKKLNANQLLTAQGYFGYDYTLQINSKVKLRGYSYYKIIEADGDSVVVQTLNHGGGTGEVTSLILIQRYPQMLKLTVLSAGDRCNHGLKDVRYEKNVSGNVLIYGEKITSYDFLTLAKHNPHHLKPYTDLMDCAICCKAVAVYRRSLYPKIAPAKLLYVDLGAFSQSPVDTTMPQKYQVCFDKLLQTYLTAGKTKLDPKQFVLFMQKFEKDCV